MKLEEEVVNIINQLAAHPTDETRPMIEKLGSVKRQRQAVESQLREARDFVAKKQEEVQQLIGAENVLISMLSESKTVRDRMTGG